MEQPIPYICPTQGLLNSPKASYSPPHLGWAEIQKVARINWSHSSLAGDSPPEHFEPNWRSVGACAILRQASKVLASMYWRSKIQGRNFGLKLKSYYANRPLGTRKWLQNLNRTPNKTFLIVNPINFLGLIDRHLMWGLRRLLHPFEINCEKITQMSFKTGFECIH